MVKKLNAEDLRRIKERADNATIGWVAVDGIFVVTLGEDGSDRIIAECDNEANAYFIGEARQDVPALIAEVERLRNENSLLCPIGDLDVITSLRTEKSMYMERIAELEAEVERLREALEFYANEDNHGYDVTYDMADVIESEVMEDCGKIARRALCND